MKNILSLPKLELMGMIIGARAAQFLKKELPIEINSTHLWSDSLASLHWISSTNPLPVFIKNRVQELQRTNINFHHVKGTENPADCCSRGITPLELKELHLWWEGPTWLSLDEPQWPSSSLTITPAQLQELQKTPSTNDSFSIATVQSKPAIWVANPFLGKFLPDMVQLQNVIDCTTYSSAKRLFNVTATVLKAAQKFKRKATDDTDLYKKAQLLWIRSIQKEHFADMFLPTPTPKTKSMMKQLNLSMDDNGIIIMQSRLSKKLILLPNHKCHLTNLFVLQVHTENYHSGISHTLAMLRDSYWVIQGKITVHAALKSCQICKKFTVKCYEIPSFGPLPTSRTQVLHPFSHISLDYCGPFKVQEGNQKVKIYVCLFTCLKIRAVHLEICPDMSAEAFFSAFRRFVARRGCPTYVLSDNALYFRVANKTLQKATHETVTKYFTYHGIQWDFLPLDAPWMGGTHEWMIGLFKTAFQKTMGNKLLTYDQFSTIVVEIEKILNSRPLTYVSETPSEPNPLTPHHFLSVNPKTDLPILSLESLQDPDYEVKPLKASDILQSWKKGQKLLESFWKSWSKDYLNSLKLPHYSKHHKQLQYSFQPKKGDVVLIEATEKPRNIWPMDIVEEIYMKDGSCRSCKIRVKKGKNKVYPVKKLYPFECAQDETVVSTTAEPNSESSENSSSTEPSSTSSSIVYCCNNSLVAPIIILSKLLSTLPSKLSILPCMLLFFVVLPIVHTTQFECSGSMDQVTPIHVPQCHNQAYLIYQLKSNYCWVKKTCPQNQFITTAGTCAKIPSECSCPTWVSFCNPAMFSVPSNISTTLLNQVIEEDQPPLCSKEPSNLCHETPITEHFFQIQTSTNMTFPTTSLNVRNFETPLETFQCLGEGKIGGTPPFCLAHKCDSDGGAKFCFYHTMEYTYYVSTTNQLIPIYAWGYVNITYYPDKLPQQPYAPIHVTLLCSRGGVDINMSSTMQYVQICSTPYCFSISQPPTLLTFQLPTAVNLKPHTIKVKVWNNGIQAKDYGIDCPAIPHCDSITCHFCLLKITNPQCLTHVELIIMLVLLGLSIYFFKFSCKMLYLLLKLLYKIVRLCIRMAFRQRAQGHFHMFLLLVMMPNSIDACAEATTLTAKQSQCMALTNNTNLQKCLFTEVTRLAMVPAGQTTCLLVRNFEDQILGTLKVKVEHIKTECQPKSEFFTRSFKMDSASSWRCPSRGACTGTTCDDTKINSKISEFDDDINNAPGFSYCTAVDGCWANGCFICSSACLFFRVYALPTTKTSYEVFTCPIWTVTVETTFTFERLTGKSDTISLTLSPGLKQTWRNIKATLIGTVVPPSPILGTTFLSDGVKTAAVSSSPAQHPISGTIGSLQCANKEIADNFNGCYLSKDICTCYARHIKMDCNCYNLNLETIMESKQRLLPLNMHGISLIGSGKNIYAEYTSISSLELQIQMTDMSLFYTFIPTKCTIAPNKLLGCYTCTTGAELKYSCTTSIPDARDVLASISCPSTKFTSICNPTGEEITVSLSFTVSAIDETCTVYCPGGSTEFRLQGQLMYVDAPQAGTYNNTGTNINDPTDVTTWPFLGFDFLNFLKFLGSNWYWILFAIGIVLILFFCFPYLLNCFSLCFSKIRKQFSKVKDSLPFYKTSSRKDL